MGLLITFLGSLPNKFQEDNMTSKATLLDKSTYPGFFFFFFSFQSPKTFHLNWPLPGAISERPLPSKWNPIASLLPEDVFC